MIHSVLYAEIDIFAALVLVIIMRRGAFARLSLDQRIFKLVLILLALLLVFDTGTWVFDGAQNQAGIVLLYLSEYAYWFVSVSVCYVLFLYCWVFTHESLDRKVAVIFAVPLAAGFILILMNPFNGSIFYFTAENVYVRGPLFLAAGGVSFIHLAAAFIVAVRKAISVKKQERKPYLMLTSFLLISLAGGLLQVCIYGLVTTWIGVTLSLLMCYVYLQNSNLAMDPLTGLNNRRRFDEYIAGQEESPDYYAEYGMMILDIDHFKSINDTYGHEEGDQALVRTAAILKKSMSDEHGFLARIGGDEFAIILPATNEDKIADLIYLIRHNLKWENETHEKPYCVGLSIGYATQFGKDLDFRKLFAAADSSMYEDKKKKRCEAPAEK
jgi:diguanylate cyclase (GGDEF)-like protein